MTRRVPMWAATAVAFVALAVGAIVGLEWRQPPVEHLTYCSLTGSHETGTPPCPPETNTLVWAAWTPGLRIPATWTGTHWRLSTPVLGISSTTVPPIAWGEL